MAKANKPESTLESRAWELFSANVVVGGTPTIEHDHLAKQCFEAASIFELVAGDFEQKETMKG